MSEFKIFSQETAPEKSQPLLEASQKAFGMVPNLHGVMAAAPTLLEGYQKLHQLAQQTSFSKEELTVVWQAINVEHSCHYCVPGHTAIAHSMKVDPAITDALRNETPLPSEKLEVLRIFTLALTRGRGEVTAQQVENFLAAGFSQQNVLEIILVLAQKVMSNYTNHLAATPVDKAFEKFAWEKKSVVVA